MSKTILPILIAFLVLWLLGGAYWLSRVHSKSSSDSLNNVSKGLVVADGNFTAGSATIFAFQTSDADVIINEEQLAMLEQLAVYLEESKEKQLRLIGWYGQNETNYSNFENLGIARAETIKNILFRNGASESRIVVEGKLFEKLKLNENGILSGGVEFEIFDKDISKIISEAPFLTEKIYYFQKNKYVLAENDDLETYAADLKQYLVDEMDAEVIITGHREADELQSIDLLRAKFIEDVFITHGIDPERISIDVNIPDKKTINSKGEKNDKKVEIKVI